MVPPSQPLLPFLVEQSIRFYTDKSISTF